MAKDPKLRIKRDNHIRELRAGGMVYKHIAERVGLTIERCRQIAKWIEPEEKPNSAVELARKWL